MEEKFRIQLKDGYSLVVSVEDDHINIDTFDEDDSWNQEIARIFARETNDGERIVAQIWAHAESEEVTNEFEIGIWHDYNPDKYESEDNSDDDVKEDITESTIIDTKLSYGDTGEDVKDIQRRLKELGYFDGAIGGNYLSRTKSAVAAFQLANGLQVDGICDKVTYGKLFSENAESVHTDDRPAYAKEMDWFKSDIQKIFPKGLTVRVVDVDTGLSWYEQRRGGSNHADVQPLTKEDTEKLKRAYGGKWAWTRRAIWVIINDTAYAASMNGMPHGGSSIKNNGFDGHHCIHFTNSRTHCSDKICPNHQKMIKKAASTPLKLYS